MCEQEPCAPGAGAPGVCRRAQKGGTEPLRVTEGPTVPSQRGQGSVLMLIRFFPPNAAMGLRLVAAAFAGVLQVPAARSGSTPSYCPDSAHSHEQAWMSLMAAGLDKAICLVCSVNAITWFKRPISSMELLVHTVTGSLELLGCLDNSRN